MANISYKEIEAYVEEVLRACRTEELIQVALVRLEKVLPYWNNVYEGKSLTSLDGFDLEYASGDLINEALEMAKLFLGRNSDGAMSSQEAKRVKRIRADFEYMTHIWKDFLYSMDQPQSTVMYITWNLFEASIVWANDLELSNKKFKTAISKTFWAQYEKGEDIHRLLQEWKVS
ncbi:MAG: hypothetical protein GY810_22385 [Aureispira sp.]|nr:hypothetical protein [Aureispira sp.]